MTKQQLIQEYNKELLDYVGETFNNKINNEVTKFLVEQKIKHGKYRRMIEEVALVVNTPVDSKEILGIGGSIPNDLIIRSHGVIHSALINPSRGGGQRREDLFLLNTGTPNLHDFVGSNTAFQPFFNTHESGSGSTPIGSQIQIGESATPPTRSDNNITDPFSNNPEAQILNANPSTYNSGLGQIKTNRTIGATGGGGTVAETVLIFSGRNIGSSSTQSLQFHDLISPTVTFLTGQNVFVEYTVQI